MTCGLEMDRAYSGFGTSNLCIYLDTYPLTAPGTHMGLWKQEAT